MLINNRKIGHCISNDIEFLYLQNYIISDVEKQRCLFFVNIPESFVNILLVDDDISSVIALKNLLEHEHTLKIASNGVDAFEFYKTGNYDVVISDIMMPKMDGIELLKAIRKNDKDTHVIILTGYPSAKNIKAAKRYNAYELFTKPLDVKRFMKVLAQIESSIG